MAAISVIMLSHNRPQFIREAINSVLWQTFSDFELLIIENSTDSFTRPIVESYNDSRIKVFYENPTVEERKAQCIVAVYSNKYVDIATGKYLYFVCDDDMILPTCLEEHYKFSEANGGCDCHSGQLWMSYSNGIWKFNEVHLNYNVVFNSKVSPSCRASVSALLANTEHVKSLGQPYFKELNPLHCSTSDARFLSDLANKYPILPLNKVLGIIRFHDNSRSFEYWREGWTP
jgi:glycosyltransferase involved in cell wall biosynthesis